ncbi:MAG: hypothetical protein ABFS39_12555 [Pseudomonadota bacterium]
MDRPRTKRIVIGLAVLALAYLAIKSLLFLWNIVVLLIVVAVLGVAGFFGLRAWKHRQTNTGSDL